MQDRLDDVYDEYNQIFNKEPSDIIKDSMTTQEKIDKIVDAIQEVETVCNERIAKALEGIQYELKRLNDSNPSNQAQVKQKEPEKKEFKPKNFI